MRPWHYKMARKWARESPWGPSPKDLRQLRMLFLELPLLFLGAFVVVFFYWALFLA